MDIETLKTIIKSVLANLQTRAGKINSTTCGSVEMITDTLHEQFPQVDKYIIKAIITEERKNYPNLSLITNEEYLENS